VTKFTFFAYNIFYCWPGGSGPPTRPGPVAFLYLVSATMVVTPLSALVAPLGKMFVIVLQAFSPRIMMMMIYIYIHIHILTYIIEHVSLSVFYIE